MYNFIATSHDLTLLARF